MHLLGNPFSLFDHMSDETVCFEVLELLDHGQCDPHDHSHHIRSLAFDGHELQAHLGRLHFPLAHVRAVVGWNSQCSLPESLSPESETPNQMLFHQIPPSQKQLVMLLMLRASNLLLPCQTVVGEAQILLAKDEHDEHALPHFRGIAHDFAPRDSHVSPSAAHLVLNARG